MTGRIVLFIFAMTALVMVCVAVGAYAVLLSFPPELPQGGIDPTTLRDLLAQESMARWTFVMVVVSIVTIVITGLGTYFIARQVELTQKSLEHSISMAEISREGAKAATVAAEANILMASQNRPWMLPDDALADLIADHPSPPFPPNTQLIGISLEQVVKNLGGTPATMLGVDFQVAHVEKAKLRLEVPDVPRFEPNAPAENQMVVPANGFIRSHPFRIEHDDFGRFVRAETAVLIYCYVRYRDVLTAREHLTETVIMYEFLGFAMEDGLQVPRVARISIGQQNQLT
ncbi:MAG: hypothetical protein KDC54_07210 [Lewinella sp.]|nr:hypothetical protein [Lewinella sp.]MCB2067463.1 hypothetical protein [Erythrobacter sp.]